MLKIGLDLSINSTGMCIRNTEVESDVRYYIIVPKITRKMTAINSNKTSRITYINYDKIADNDSSNIKSISEKICEIIKDLKGDVEVVIEDVAMRARGRSIITLTLLNGYMRARLDTMNVKYKTITPTQWKKKLLGNGQADKELTIYNWAKLDNRSCVMMMNNNCKTDDIADAYFLSFI